MTNDNFIQKRDQLHQLLQLAMKDGKLHPKEESFIKQVALAMGLNEDQWMLVLTTEPSEKPEIPKSEKDRMEWMFHMLFLMRSDGDIDGEEKILIQELGFKLGLNEVMVNEFILVIEAHPSGQVPDNALLDIIKKYNN